MTIVPIFQMILQPNEDGSMGLTFSEETEDYVQPAFAIPAHYGATIWYENSYYMPGEVNGEYTEFDFGVSGVQLISNDKRLRFPISCQLGYYYDLYNWDKMIARGYSIEFIGLDYIGERKDFVYPFTKFLVISPNDLLIMDILYRENRISFVGLTPTFGQKRQFGENTQG